jgi:nitrite reductase (NADH) large subunit
VPVFSAGDFEGAGQEQIILQDETSGIYRKFVVRDNRLRGVVLMGDTADALWYRDLIRSGSDISRLRDTLAFGRFDREAA